MNGITVLGGLGALSASIAIVLLAGRDPGVRAFRAYTCEDFPTSDSTSSG